MFSGVKSADGTLTGVAQGKDCITIDGVKHSGMFGLKNGEIVFSIDDAGNVNTTGNVIASAIKATGLNINDKFIVDKDGKIKAADGEFIGKVETSKDGKRVIISPDTSSLLMVDSLGNKALEISFPTWTYGSTSAFGSYITIKSHRTMMQVGESLPWDSTIVISDEEISMEGTYNEYGVSGTVKRKVSINPYGISFYKNGSLKKTYNNE